MVKVSLTPAHPLKVGVTIMVLVMGVLVVLVAVNAGKLPVLDALERPIAVLLFVQLYTVPLIELVKTLDDADCPAQKVVSALGVIIGVGFTSNGLLSVLVPHSLVTETLIVKLPAIL